MGADWSEKQLYILIHIQLNIIGIFDDVESDGEIRFLIRLRISDTILGYILH